MAQEEKELLLRDLCERLPYGVKVFYKYKTWDSEKFATSIRLADGKIALSSKFEKEGDWFSIEEAGEILIKPYLRPMSSVTEEEIKELSEIDMKRDIFSSRHLTWHLDGEIIDYLNKKMLDWRRLIPRGLAFEAPKGMYNLNNE